MAVGGIELQRAKLPGILNDLECQPGALQRGAGPRDPGPAHLVQLQPPGRFSGLDVCTGYRRVLLKGALFRDVGPW